MSEGKNVIYFYTSHHISVPTTLWPSPFSLKMSCTSYSRLALSQHISLTRYHTCFYTCHIHQPWWHT